MYIVTNHRSAESLGGAGIELVQHRGADLFFPDQIGQGLTVIAAVSLKAIIDPVVRKQQSRRKSLAKAGGIQLVQASNPD